MNWVAVMIALTRFVKKCDFILLCWSQVLWAGPWDFCSFGCLVMLVTCQPPTGCAIGTMTVWTFGSSWGCSSRFTSILLAGFGHCVWSCCTVTSVCPCDCSVACKRCCPNSPVKIGALSSNKSVQMGQTNT